VRVGQSHIYTVCNRVYGNIGREITKYAVIYGVYTVILAGRSPSMQSYTVCVYGNIGREITKYAVIYGVYTVMLAENHQVCSHTRCVYTVILAGKSPSMQSYTVCVYCNIGRDITKYAVIYGVCIR